MAYSKIKAIRTNLRQRIEYIINPEKTALSAKKNPARDEEKEDRYLYVSTYNCNMETAAQEMMDTKQRWQKAERKKSVLGYHLIISFSPGEATPEEVHQCGRELVERLLAEKYEAVLATHLDKDHLHNHIVFNAVSYVDGTMYRNTFKDYFGDIRSISDEICREKGLSVITPQGKGKQYAEWNAQKNGKPTIRDMIKLDIDEAVQKSFTFKSFLEVMEKNGYAVKYGGHVKHTAVKPKGSKRFFRLDTLGEGYREEDIRERLYQQQQKGKFSLVKEKRVQSSNRYAHVKGSYQKSRKITGIRALYWHYLYLLGKVKKRTAPKKITPLLYEEVIRFEKYVEQNRFLAKNKIRTNQDLIDMKSFFNGELNRLVSERKRLYEEVKRGNGTIANSEEYQKLGQKIKDCRRQIRQCERIEETVERMEKYLQEIKETSQREEVAHEPGKRSSRTNDKRNFADFRNRGKAGSDRS